MRITRVTRYIADCGRGFWNKRDCLSHDEVCTCWSNPKNKACKTCAFGEKVRAEPEVGADGYWECNNPRVDGEHTGAPKGHDYISVGCVYHELPDNKKGPKP